MKKLLIALLLAALLVPAALAEIHATRRPVVMETLAPTPEPTPESPRIPTTSEYFDYDAIVGYAQRYYGELYTIVGRVLQVEEYHRSSAPNTVEEYVRLAVDDDPHQIISLHYHRPKLRSQLAAGVYVAVLASVDGVQRIDKMVIPLLEANSAPTVVNEDK